MPPATTVDDTNNLGEGDSYLVLDLLSVDENWMEKLKQEVQFKVMLHRGLVYTSVFENNAHLHLQGEKFLGWSQCKAR